MLEKRAQILKQCGAIGVVASKVLSRVLGELGVPGLRSFGRLATLSPLLVVRASLTSASLANGRVSCSSFSKCTVLRHGAYRRLAE